jgi:MFS family permease
MAALYGMAELVFGVSAATFEEVGGSDRLAGLAPALFVVCSGLAAFTAGRRMDRSGRRPVLIAGFTAGLLGCLLAALGVSAESLALVLLGFAFTGVALGTVLLSRVAGADMYPPERRPQAISLILFGAVFGALLGPLVFSPLLEDGEALDLAWLGGAGFTCAGIPLVSQLRPDPREIAKALGTAADGETARVPVLQAASAPGVPPAVVAIVASLAGMATVMSLVGSALVDHGHEHDAVFPVLAAHFVGMFAFFPLVGPFVARIGPVKATSLGLLILAGCCLVLSAVVENVHLTGLVLFGVGLGWSLSFVAATTELTERVPLSLRTTLVGFADLVANLTSAALVLAGGVVLDALGVGGLGILAAVLPVLAALWILISSRETPARAAATP